MSNFLIILIWGSLHVKSRVIIEPHGPEVLLGDVCISNLLATHHQAGVLAAELPIEIVIAALEQLLHAVTIGFAQFGLEALLSVKELDLLLDVDSLHGVGDPFQHRQILNVDTL